LSDILNGKIIFPKPVYFIDNGPLSDILSIKYQNGGTVSNNFHYLGNFGFKTIEGFKICFLSGTENLRKLENRSDLKNNLLKKCNVYVPGDYEQVVSSVVQDPEFKGVDFLLTCEWPSNIEISSSATAAKIQKKESDFIAKLAFQTMPRYHFCANNDCFVQRPPFINYDSMLQPKHVCRFIAIGRFPSDTEKSKGKYLYAI
jgi:hypothetical protein